MVLVVVVLFGQVSVSFLHPVQGLLSSGTPGLNPLGKYPCGLYGGRSDKVVNATTAVTTSTPTTIMGRSILLTPQDIIIVVVVGLCRRRLGVGSMYHGSQSPGKDLL